MTGPEKRQGRLPREHSASSRNAGPDNRDPQSLVEAGRVCRASSSSLAQRINTYTAVTHCWPDFGWPQRRCHPLFLPLVPAAPAPALDGCRDESLDGRAWPMSEVTYEELFPPPVAKDQ